MGYIQEIRKYVRHSPIMVTAAQCALYTIKIREYY